MNGAQIRSTFLDYFQTRGHTIVGSSALIPRNDPTLFFTNSGMVQFKNTFTGDEKREYSRATTVQKCLRVSGKHNDLENVGVTPRHHTFFEMLGNFSFGDYFKRDAIRFAWDLLLNVYKLDPDKLWITVFREDDEAFEIWRDQEKVPERRIVRLDEKDNFWAMGDTGPCGPCSEIHIDKQAYAGKGLNPKSIAEDPEGYLEIWNLVFMQFERSADGVLTPLPRPSIDTGMGLERLASVLQGKASNYDTDLFQPIIQRVSELCRIPYGQADATDTSMRVIADHARAAAFLICDGILPSNEDRGYVLRRIMRRAIRHGVKLGLKEGFFDQAVSTVVETMGAAFSELPQRQTYLHGVVLAEEEAFARTLDRGLKLYREQADSLKSSGSATLPGEFAFKLADTYGFPLDLTEVIAAEEGLTVDHQGFHKEMDRQREMARKAWKGSGEEGISGIYQGLRNDGLATEFLGYDHSSTTGTITALLKGGTRVSSVTEGDEVEIITDRTAFYAESGGQVGDQGRIERLSHHANGVDMILQHVDGQNVARAVAVRILDTQSPVEGLIVHKGVVEAGTLSVGDPVRLEINVQRRAATRRNHTATHLMHSALRQVLGTHVSQRGSLVGPDRLRFDFSHFKPMSHDEIRQVELWVNNAILENVALDTQNRSLQEAMDAGVMALFGEKYGDVVRVVQIPAFSAELCGGTHVQRTGDIGAFKLLSEGGIQAGVRRVEAATGLNVVSLLHTWEDQNRQLSDALKASPSDIPARVTRLQDEKKELEKTVEQLKRKLAQGSSSSSIETRTRDVAGVKVLSMRIDLDDPKALREEADRLRNVLGSGIVALGARSGDDKVSLVITISKDLVGRFHAGNLVRDAAKYVDGAGGGKPDTAQAGGKNPAKLDEALDAVFDLVAKAAG